MGEKGRDVNSPGAPGGATQVEGLETETGAWCPSGSSSAADEPGQGHLRLGYHTHWDCTELTAWKESVAGP